MRNNSKGFVQILVVILLLVLVGGAAYYFGAQKGKISLNPTPVSSTEPSAIPSVKPTSDPTANWKTYTKLGVSFRYPGDILSFDGSDTSVGHAWANTAFSVDPTNPWKTNFLRLDISVQKIDPTSQTYLNRPSPSLRDYPDNTNITDSMIKLYNIDNGKDGVAYFQGSSVDSTTHDNQLFVAQWIDYDNLKLYNLILTAHDKNFLFSYRQVFDQILSTFKFTN